MSDILMRPIIPRNKWNVVYDVYSQTWGVSERTSTVCHAPWSGGTISNAALPFSSGRFTPEPSGPSDIASFPWTVDKLTASTLCRRSLIMKCCHDRVSRPTNGIDQWYRPMVSFPETVDFTARG